MGLNFKGSVPTFADLPATGQQQGDSYVVADENDKLYVWDADTNQWVDGGSIQGPAGPAGAPGPRGTSWFVGNGPPPAVIEGSQDGDLYLDLDTGDVYQLGTPAGIPVSELPAIGAAFEGGYYAGLYSLNADGAATHALVVAPKATGQNTSATWKNAASDGTGYESTFDGYANTEAAAGVGGGVYPAAEWARGLTIGGFSDWYIPSRFELNAIYWNLKPGWAGDSLNAAFEGFGNNLYAVPQRGDFGESENPNGVTAGPFSLNQSEAFTEGPYSTSTEGATATTQGSISFASGGPFDYAKNSTSPDFRAIRKVAVIP